MRAGDFRVTAAVVASALFMQNLDSTVVATALPSMARELGVNVVFLSSAITSYLVALTVFIPVSGWIAERFGAKRVFIAAIAIFTAASVMCAAANGLATLVAARILQGAGGALMVPVGRLILYRGVSRHEMLAATTWLTMPALVGPLLGPPLGGFLTDALSWRAVFWINVPVGVAGAALAARLVPASAGERRAPADARGMLLVGAALAALMLGVETAGRGVLPAGAPALCLGAGVALGGLAIRHCRRVAHPAVDLSLLGIPTFHAATIAGSLFRAGAGALPFLVPLTLQVGFGASASRSGAITLASALGSLVMRPMTHAALHRAPMRTVLIAGSVAGCGRLRAAARRRAVALAQLRVARRARILGRAERAPVGRDVVPGNRAAVDAGGGRRRRGGRTASGDADRRARPGEPDGFRLRVRGDRARRARVGADVRRAAGRRRRRARGAGAPAEAMMRIA
ncbi:major Facilitator Superfamily protein [Burkholderia pseudomallei A79D]|nr:major Facilitator Superfamily protein [Burkholderia pseudomallei K42]AIV91205.1 major Facilitator Superfamily protein [Burkholderia pseudomallei B03]AIV95615.1 major Facilitator Superfamily protein [Burkholderia pseudomallei A79A]KGX98543.1 major Facilitator Superfamily protein [Burkholderia pseudomallei A79D]KGX99808.1 major Facilitator Superfamily protein [Burkholderia pseudomallei A79C]